jgi:tRNA pseudouridine(55) synthase
MFYIKESGHTMIQTMDKFKKENNINEKVCYCGRLDPMARGVVLLLVGNECKKMDQYLSTIKEYEFEILFGLSTDTDDPMGVIENIYNYDEIDTYVERIKDYLSEKCKIGKFLQNFHNYSSKRINGKPLWEYMKNNSSNNSSNNISIEVNHEVEIFDVEYKYIKKYNFIEWKNNIIDTINKIDKKNDFRQDIIINNYNLLDINNIIYSLPIKIKVSSGFYVRQLVADIKKHFNIVILTYDINRININIHN